MSLIEKTTKQLYLANARYFKVASLMLWVLLATIAIAGNVMAANVIPNSDSQTHFDSEAQSQCYIKKEFLQALHAASAAIFDERWQRARDIADSLSSRDETSPCALLIRAGVLQARMFSREEKGDEKLMGLFLDSAEVDFEKRLQTANSQDSALILYFIGNCHTYRSLWEAKFGSLVTAIKQGLQARDSYQMGLAVDSGFPDLYLGVGAYLYWKSAKSGVLRWSGIIKDERLLGIEHVEKAVAEAIIAPDGARSALIFILMNEKKYLAAAEIADGLAVKYSNGATFLWPLAQCYSKMNTYTLARDTYLQIRAKLIDDPGNQINLLKTDYALYQLAKRLEDKATIELVGKGFEVYSRDTPRKTRRLLRDEYRILKRL